VIIFQNEKIIVNLIGRLFEVR